jgi:hypothetical protein
LEEGAEAPLVFEGVDDVEGVTVVRDKKAARKALKALNKHRDQYFACDTEVG